MLPNNKNKSSKYYYQNKIKDCSGICKWMIPSNFMTARFSDVSRVLPTSEYQRGAPVIPNTKTILNKNG